MRFINSRIATTAFTFSATAAAILNAGHRPVFCDVDPLTMVLSSKTIPDDVAAVVPVDLFGRPCQGPWPVPCVQDASQAVGSDGAGCYAPGDVVTWSFNGRKNVPAGEGGMVLTADAEIERRLRLRLSHGENFDSPDVGTNGHLHEVAACLAWHGLMSVARRNAVRQARARQLNRLLAGLPVQLPDPTDHAFYVYPVMLDAGVDRDRLVRVFTRLGVHSQPGYIQPPIHRYPAFAGCERRVLPVTEELSMKTLLLLPTQITSATTRQDILWLAARVRAAFSALGT